MAKPLANGYPVGAVMMREEIAQTMSVGKLAAWYSYLLERFSRPGFWCFRNTRDNFRRLPTGVCNRTPCIATSIGQGVR